MNTTRAIYHLARADFFERTRRYSFLLVLAAIIYMGVLVNKGAIGMELAAKATDLSWIRYRGEFNSAWIGAMTVMVINTFLGLFGFFLVSGCIERDIRTGVGQIIATTPLRRAVYLVGKWLSNFLVLSLLVLILAVAAAIMVLLKGEAALELRPLLMPFLAVALPNMALTAALAVVFDTVPWLRGAVGNVVYFFGWIISLFSVLLTGKLLFIKDPIGQGVFSASIYASAHAAYPQDAIREILGVQSSNPGAFMANLFDMPEFQLKVFNWPGLDWTPGVVAGQWFWVLFGLGLVLLSATWFARFDPSREGLRHLRAKPVVDAGGRLAELWEKVHSRLPDLSPFISNLAQASPFLGVLFAELRLLLKGRRWWWWLVLLGLNIVILAGPASMVKDFLLPIAWLWPLPIWSEMGNRERKYNTTQMVFSSARPVLRQLPAAWLAGVLATALFEIAGALVFLINGDLTSLAGWVGAVIFIPALALALGVFSSGSRVFEVVYLLWWYMGPFQKTPWVDFTSGAPQFYLLVAAGLLLLAAFWRGRQVRV